MSRRVISEGFPASVQGDGVLGGKVGLAETGGAPVVLMRSGGRDVWVPTVVYRAAWDVGFAHGSAFQKGKESARRREPEGFEKGGNEMAAWRPHRSVIAGELDNTVPGKVTGWMRFAGLDEKVTFDLEGDFHRDIRGAKITFENPGHAAETEATRGHMRGFSTLQTGKVGDMTAGLPPQDYVDYPYLEWYSDHNGRVVLELEPGQVHQRHSGRQHQAASNPERVRVDRLRPEPDRCR